MTAYCILNSIRPNFLIHCLNFLRLFWYFVLSPYFYVVGHCPFCSSLIVMAVCFVSFSHVSEDDQRSLIFARSWSFSPSDFHISVQV